MTRPVALKAQWFQILLAVADKPLHGTAIMEEVLERTGGGMRLWPGTLYGSLGELERAGFLEETEPPASAPTDRGKRRFYTITRAGRAALRTEVSRLAGYVAAARAKGVAGV